MLDYMNRTGYIKVKTGYGNFYAVKTLKNY
jgi:hypothetical protein